MKPLLTICVIAAILGVGLGAVLGYYDARPWAFELTVNNVPLEGGAEAPADGPRFSIDEPTFNFDVMERGTFKRHNFMIENSGAKPLSVTFLSNTCKCTSVELNGKEVSKGDKIWIEPGDAGEATLEWEAKQPAGPFRHGATFQTNDPVNSRLTLQVEGDVVESMTLSPAYLYFGAMQAGKPGQSSVYVMSFDDQEVEILSHEVADNDDLAEHLTMRVEDVDPSELPNERATSGKRIVAELQTIGAIGSFRGTLQLETNIQNAEKLVVPVSGMVRGDISVFGKDYNRDAGLLKLEDVRSSDGARVELSVNVRGEQAQAAQVSVASVDPPVMQVSLGEPRKLGDAAVMYPMIVEIPKGADPLVRVGEDDEFGGDGEGEIVLASTHPTTPEVRIRVRLVIKP